MQRLEREMGESVGTSSLFYLPQASSKVDPVVCDNTVMSFFCFVLFP